MKDNLEKVLERDTNLTAVESRTSRLKIECKRFSF